MPDYRLTPKREANSDKLTSLDHLAYRVWQQYKASADDYGVMPDSAATIRGDNRRLEKEPEKLIRACLDQMIQVGLVHRFIDQGQAYLYSRVWQTHQKVRYPSETFYPAPPPEELAQCDKKTRAFFEQRFAKSSEMESEALERDDPPPTRAHSRNANTLSNAHALKGEEPEKGPALDLAPGQLRLAASQLVAEWNVRVGPLGELAYVHNPEPSIGRVIAAVRLRPDLTEWRTIIDRSLRSDFLMGRVPGPDGKTFRLDFWWLLKDDHADRVLSGRYDNREQAKPPAVDEAERKHQAALKRTQDRLAGMSGGVQ